MLQFSPTGVPELLKAFVAAQSEMDGAKKNAANPAFKSKYADLAAVCDAVMEALTKAKIAVIQSPTYDENGVTIQTIFAHESGGMMWEFLTLKPTNATPQGVGSAITYGRRYALAAMCGIAPEDDDGNAAGAVIAGPKAAAARQPAPPAKPNLLETAKLKFAEAATADDLKTRMDYFSARVLEADRGALAELYHDATTRFETPIQEAAE